MKPKIDPQYITERDKLIPLAERRANKEFGCHAPGGHRNEEWYEKWSRCFHRTMNRLWRQRNEGGVCVKSKFTNVGIASDY